MRRPEVFVVGTSHSVAPATLRERMHVERAELHDLLSELLAPERILDEAVPVTTCARLEVYGVSRDPERASEMLVRLLARRAGIDREKVREHAYALRGPTAVRHLLRVAAGLDSVVHGEAQILGQVRAAAYDERSVEGKGPILHRLFDIALSTGKAVRSETEIGRGAASLASAGLGVVRSELGSLDDVTAVVVGAGDTGALVARLLGKSGVGRLVVANRTLDTARDVAGPLGGEAVALDEIPALLHEADLVVGAATASEYLLTPESLAGRNGSRPRPLHLLDLAHPRNFDPALGELDGVRLFDLDLVFERVEAARASRAAQIPKAEAIVRDRADRFEDWLRSRDTVDVVRAVRKHVLELAEDEAERFGQGRSDDEKEQMRRLARSLARTLLHRPTVALRGADPESEEGRRLLEDVPALFGLGSDDD